MALTIISMSEMDDMEYLSKKDGNKSKEHSEHEFLN